MVTAIVGGVIMIIAGVLLARPLLEMMGTPQAVSYTHLDVYKRQVLHTYQYSWYRIIRKGLQNALNK